MRIPRPARRMVDEAFLDEAIGSYPRAELPERLVKSSMARIREEAADGGARVPAPRFRLQFLDLALGAFFAFIGGVSGLMIWSRIAMPDAGAAIGIDAGQGLTKIGTATSEAMPTLELALLLPIGGLLVLGLASFIVLMESMPGQTVSHARRTRA